MSTMLLFDPETEKRLSRRPLARPADPPTNDADRFGRQGKAVRTSRRCKAVVAVLPYPDRVRATACTEDQRAGRTPPIIWPNSRSGDDCQALKFDSGACWRLLLVTVVESERATSAQE